MADRELDHQEGTYESQKDIKDDRDRVRAILEAIDLAGAEEEDWRDDAKEAEETFESEENTEGTAFNLYFSNIQTLTPSLYNSTPIPDVRRRFNDDDPVGKTVSQILERSLSWAVDQYDFDSFMNDVVFDTALPGRGVGCVTYKPTLGEVQPGVEDIVYQEVGCEHRQWTSFRHGPARRWADVPWVAFSHYYTREAIEELAGAETAKEVPLDMRLSTVREGDTQDDMEKSLFKRALVWEFWDKDRKKVYFVAPGYKDKPLKVVDDPLELQGFFPCPRPILAISRAGKLKPVCEFRIYKSLLCELDEITLRIRRLIKQLRPRALSALKTADAQSFAKAGDGVLVEVSDVAAMLDSGGIDKLLSWFPLDPTIKALAQLYIQRDNVKTQIYEVTGMADIMRGQTNPNETLGAQQIKAQWGSLRIQFRQKEIQRFVRDIFRMKAEIIANKFTPGMLAAICGPEIQLTPEVLAMLKDDVLRSYRVDIETDSTIKGDLARNQEAMSNFVTATGTFFQAMTPAVQAGVMTIDVATVVFQSFCRNFSLSRQAGDALDSLVQSAQAKQKQIEANPPPDPAQQELQLKQQEIQAGTQAKAQELQMKQQESQMKLQFEQQKMGFEQQKHEQQMGFEFESHRQKMDLEREKMSHQSVLEERKMTQMDALESRKMDQASMIEGQKMNREDARSQQDMAMRGDELKFQRNLEFDKAMNEGRKPVPGSEEGEIPQEPRPLDQLQEALAMLAQAMAQNTQALTMLVKISAAPAELVMNEMGRPVGARKVLPTLN